MIIAVDLDGMLLAFPEFFAHFFPSMQAAGNVIGILTTRDDGKKDEILEELESKLGIKPQFFITMPNSFEDEMSHGKFKAKVCNDLEVDILFDDFQASDNKMLAEFFSINQRTVPFTSWAYEPK